MNTVSEKDQIIAKYINNLDTLKVCNQISCSLYCEVLDFGVELLDKIYELGKSENTATIETQGYWDNGYKNQRCSVCRQNGKKSWKFCPNCGSRMCSSLKIFNGNKQNT